MKSYPDDIISIGDMRSPTNGKTYISAAKTHNGNNGAIDIRYLGNGGSYRGQYTNSQFDSGRNKAFIQSMGENGLIEFLLLLQ